VAHYFHCLSFISRNFPVARASCAFTVPTLTSRKSAIWASDISSANRSKIRPNLTISTEGEQTRALRLLQKAKSVCLVSRALSVEQKFEPRVQVVGESRVEFSQTLPVG
jgi:organic hydroperoxide reductase OsmC/OhrA